MSDDDDSSKGFSWGLTPRDPDDVAAEQLAEDAAAQARRDAAATTAAAQAAQAKQAAQSAQAIADSETARQRAAANLPLYQQPAAFTPPPAPPREEPQSPATTDVFAIFTPPATEQVPVAQPAPPSQPAPPELVEPPEPLMPWDRPMPTGGTVWNAPVADAAASAASSASPPPEVTTPAEPEPVKPAGFDWNLPPAPPLAPEDTPTVASAYIDLPTEQYDVHPPAQTYPWDQPTELTPEQPAPFDAALAGPTEVYEAQPVATPTPEGESASTAAIDNLFGAGAFQEYEDEPLLGQLPFTATTTEDAAPKLPHAPLSSLQKTLLWVAAGLVAVLVLVGLFLAGTRLAVPQVAAPAPIETPSAEKLIPVPKNPEIGPVAPGDYAWNALLGSECVEPFENAWQQKFTVVDCGQPHHAQMAASGIFDDALADKYPGADELESRINELCTARTVINYKKAGAFDDIQVSASYAATEAEWNAGNRTYYCFVSRASGDTLDTTVAKAPKAVTPVESVPAEAP